MFGPEHEALISSICNSPDPMYQAVCNAFLLPANATGLYKEQSLKYYEHVQQNTSIRKFAPFIEDTNIQMDLIETDPLSQVTIPVTSFHGASDVQCPSA